MGCVLLFKEKRRQESLPGGCLICDMNFYSSPSLTWHPSLRLIRECLPDTVQEECFLFDLVPIQIILELLKQVCRYLNATVRFSAFIFFCSSVS